MNPIETYILTVKTLCPLANADDLGFLEKELTISKLPANELYLQANKKQKNVGFVFSGLLRAFYTDDNGNEITIRFVKEFDFATDYVAFINQTPSKYSFQCIEDCEIVNISYNHIQESYTRFPSLEKYGRVIAEEILKNQQKRIESFLFENAEQRYINFVKENPNLNNRVSLSYLSSYLGIERPSLSRIRKKISRN